MPAARAQALDCDLSFTTGGDGGATWGTEDWVPYYGPEMAAGGNIGADEQVWMQTSVTVSDGQKMSFYWKVSSEEGGDYLKFYINDQYQAGISGNVDWQKKSYTFSGSGTKTLKWVYSRDSSGEAYGENCGWVDGLTVGTESVVGPPNALSEALDCDLKFTSVADDDDLWTASPWPVPAYYLNGDAVRTNETLADSNEAWLQTIVESDSAETVKFYWKVSSEQDGDYLQFYIDSTLKDQISGEVDWQQKSYSVTSGTHILRWCYVKNSSGSSGDDCAWVDFVQWTGPSPAQDPSNWQEIAYKHDVLGRRVEKRLVVSSSNPSDGYSTRYVHDGDEIIAEYDGNNNLLRKYIYGPCIDEPICMIEVADSNATYYYHYDALGSVVALSNSSGDTVQTYEYSVFGEVAVEDANHPNPYMFAGVRFDIEIGLYYNRARYYNPYTGRFLQTDPIGYGAGMNLYRYCTNNPLNLRDPSGRDPCGPNDPCGLLQVGQSVADLGSDIVDGVTSLVSDACDLVQQAVQQILDDIESHQEVAFYVIGPNGVRIPVKIFESRSVNSGIPGLSGVSINIGNEIHIGPEMAAELIQQQVARDALGIDLEYSQNPMTINSPSWDATYWERIMAHEIGHQVDADNLGPVVYQAIGLVATQDPNSWFEQNAWNRGEYYGIDWNYKP